MDDNANRRIDVDGKPENADRALHMQPGALEDIENATAYANRTGQQDVTGETPRRGAGDRTGHVASGQDLGHGMHATPADGLQGADGRIHRGEDVGNGIEARPADGYDDADGRITHGEEIGNGIRARRAGEQDPGNPLV
jgi:hypothetical protein